MVVISYNYLFLAITAAIVLLLGTPLWIIAHYLARGLKLILEMWEMDSSERRYYMQLAKEQDESGNVILNDKLKMAILGFMKDMKEWEASSAVLDDCPEAEERIEKILDDEMKG